MVAGGGAPPLAARLGQHHSSVFVQAAGITDGRVQSKNLKMDSCPETSLLGLLQKGGMNKELGYFQEPRPLEIGLPDGTNTSVVDMTEKLKSKLPFENVTRNGMVFRTAITWSDLIKALKKTLKIYNSVAVAFLQHLISKQILVQATGETFRENPDGAIYRLYCDHAPWIVNSYCAWEAGNSNNMNSSIGGLPSPAAVEESPAQIVRRLDGMMREIEVAAAARGTEGPIDFKLVHSHRHYPRLEEAICQLQVVSMEDDFAETTDRLAFCMNVYHLMIKCAFFKLGVVDSSDKSSHLAFFKKVQFSVGGELYCFTSWERKIQKYLGEDGGETDIGDEDQTLSTEFTVSSAGSSQTGSMATAVPLPMRKKIRLALKVGWEMGSVSQLPFRLFKQDVIYEQIDTAVKVYLNDSTNVSFDLKARKVALSKELSTFISRLDKKLLRSIVAHLDGDNQKSMLALLDGGKFKVTYHQHRDYTRNIQNFATFNEANLEVNAKKQSAVTALVRRFKPPATPNNEALRWSTLRSHNLLDTLPEERFDRITRMAQNRFNVQLVSVALVDHDRFFMKSTQWHEESIGMAEVKEAPRNISFCGHTVCGGRDEILCVRDALEDDRFADSPLVQGPLGIRFYAGCPLSIPSLGRPGETVNIGTLCIIDQSPRNDFDENQLDVLRQFAHAARDEVMSRYHEQEYHQRRCPSKDSLEKKKKRLKSNKRKRVVEVST